MEKNERKLSNYNPDQKKMADSDKWIERSILFLLLLLIFFSSSQYFQLK